MKQSRRFASYRLSKVKSKNTKAELLFRSYIWKQGVRGYRVKNALPGKPDLVFPKHKVVVFIDGCFWHGCPKCYRAPDKNKEYWRKKVITNKERDERANVRLVKMGYLTLRFWEHQVNQEMEKCYRKLQKGLGQ
jgi:DNA mismatch endonuclease (patch repair protein)